MKKKTTPKKKQENPLKDLQAALAKAKKKMMADPSTANVDAYDLIQKKIQELNNPQPAEGDTEPGELKFYTLLEVLDWLKKNGWKIEQSTIYDHKKRGKISKGRDGLYHLKTIKSYAENNLEPLDGSNQNSTDEDFKRRNKAEADKSELAAQMLKLKLDAEAGLYLKKEFVEAAWAARATFYKTNLKNFAHSFTPEIIAIAEGNPATAPVLLAFLLRKADEMMDGFVKEKEFRV